MACRARSAETQHYYAGIRIPTGIRSRNPNRGWVYGEGGGGSCVSLVLYDGEKIYDALEETRIEITEKKITEFAQETKYEVRSTECGVLGTQW